MRRLVAPLELIVSSLPTWDYGLSPPGWEKQQDDWVCIRKSLVLLVHLLTFKDYSFLDRWYIDLIYLHKTVVIIGSAVGQNMAWKQSLHFGEVSEWVKQESFWPAAWKSVTYSTILLFWACRRPPHPSKVSLMGWLQPGAKPSCPVYKGSAAKWEGHHCHANP